MPDAHARPGRCFAALAVVAAGVTGLLACDGHAPALSYAATIAEGRAAIQEVMADAGATAVSVAFVDGDRLVWSEAFGDRVTGTAATTSTLFGICSVSKMISTTAVMLLVDRGRVELDEPVTRYLPAFAMPLDDRYRSITVRMLLDHSSGLPGNDMRGILTAAPNPGYAAEMMTALAVQRLKHDPGAFSAYNNDGFSMIANLVEAVSGQSFPDFVQENVLAPLGMQASRYATVPVPEDRYAHSYAGADLQPLLPVNGYATGGLYSTPEEMTHLAIMLLGQGVYGGQRILSSSAVATMAEDQRAGTFDPVPDGEYRFGLGWDTVAQPGLAAVGVRAWQKTGDMGGFYAANLIVVPDERLAVVVLGASNAFESGHAVTISERILLRALVERGRLAAMPAPLPTADRPVRPVPAADPGTYAGCYGSSAGLYRVSFAADDSLTVEQYGDAWTPRFQGLRLRDDGWYAADGVPATGLSLLTTNGRAYLARRQPHGAGHYTTATLFAMRFAENVSLSAAWQARGAERWLPVNADAADLMRGDPSFAFHGVPDLPGQLRGRNLLEELSPAAPDRLDGTFLAMPDASRSLVDAAIERWGGEDWLRHGSFLYRPRSTLPLVAAGSSAVSIGADGFTEWRTLPASGSLAVGGASYWFVYDAQLAPLASGTGDGDATLTGAGEKILALLGPAGTTVALELQ